MTTEKKLPDELKNILPPSTPDECMLISQELKNPTNSVDKYRIYLAQTYFKQNITKFNKEQFLTIIENNNFHKNLTGKFSQDILKKCIKEQVSFPVVISGWFDKGTSYSDKIEYLKIINQENNKEQLDIFYEKDERIVDGFFSNALYQSDSLILSKLKKEPEKIINVFSWSQDKICDWLKNNSNKTEQILNKSIGAWDKVPEKVQFQLYENLLSSLTKKENSKLKHLAFVSLPANFFEYTKNNYSDFFQNTIKETIKYEYKDDKFVEMNYLQYLLYKRPYPSNNEISFFSEFKPLLLEDVLENVSFYNKKTHPFEFALRTEEYNLALPFSLNDNFGDDEKNMLTAIAFSHLKQTFTNPKNSKYRSILNDWYQEILIQTPIDTFNSICDEILKKSTNNLTEEINSIKLFKQLHSDLHKKDISSKKMKI
jgi:hypothetical protein